MIRLHICTTPNALAGSLIYLLPGITDIYASPLVASASRLRVYRIGVLQAVLIFDHALLLTHTSFCSAHVVCKLQQRTTCILYDDSRYGTCAAN